MQEMPREQRHSLWGKLASLLQAVLRDLPPEQWDKGGKEDMEVESTVDPVCLSNGVYMLQFCTVNILLHIKAHTSIHISARIMSWP